jgi:hypothetical protein
MKGWHFESNRHALAARGITLKSREELDYALHRRGQIYPGEISQSIWYDIKDKYPDEFNIYKPVSGEIQALKNIRQLIDIFERRRYRPLTPQEIGIVRYLIKDFMRKVKKKDISLTSRKDQYDMLGKYLYGISDKESRDILFAAETVLFLMHWSGDVIDKYIGRDITEVSITREFRNFYQDRESVSPRVSMSARVVLEALAIQRGGHAGSGEMPIGEGQILIDLWVEELERRRLS